MIEAIHRIFLMTWLWVIFAGFYLVAYAFWVPRVFANIWIIIGALILTLVLGGGQLLDGFHRAMELQYGKQSPMLPYRRVWHFVSGAILLGFVLVYFPPSGRIVAHWPLDLGITVVSGILMIAYSILNK
ncbi:MAG: hypothetical protein ACHQ1H_03545 [Nitrososphaerales archaeon]